MAKTRARRSAHDPGRVLRDLVVMLTDGGDCLSDLSAMRDQADLFGQVASTPTAYRVIESIGPEELEGLREARRLARARAWAMGAAPTEIVLDFDAALITAHSEKEGAAGNYKGGFSFYPLFCYLDQSREALGQDCCARATPAPTPSVTTWRHWPRLCASYPRAHTRCRSWPVPIAPGPAMTSWMLRASWRSCSRSALT